MRDVAPGLLEEWNKRRKIIRGKLNWSRESNQFTHWNSLTFTSFINSVLETIHDEQCLEEDLNGVEFFENN